MDWPDRLAVRPLSPTDVREIATWRYAGPWRIYDSDGPLPAAGYLAVAGEPDGPLVGFCCAGVEARVPGLAEEPGVLDIGVGMAPDLVGQGHGLAFGNAVLDHFAAPCLRAVVQAWNERSRRLTRALGFVEDHTHTCVQDGQTVEYLVLVRPDSRPPGVRRSR
jgi:[ribosomal protein S18]-alanine N-acetyltransferase